MPNHLLFEKDGHKNILLEDFSGGLAVQANQHVIVHNGEAMILDPGGHKVYSRVLAATGAVVGRGKLRYIFLSHQDPDIVAAVNGWLMTTDAEAWISTLWIRFVPHFGLDRLVESRLKPIPDEGMTLELGGEKLLIIPAHFLHSEGNFQVYDPISKILYTGDLGASVGPNYVFAPSFDEHVKTMEGFHRRYMPSSKALRAWARMVRDLEIETIAPQHGAVMRGKEMCTRFIDWCAELECGIDLLEPIFKIPR